MKKVSIIKVTEEQIVFSDYSYIFCSHEQDCCENNYADFLQIDDLAKVCTYLLPLRFESCEGGFRFGNKYRLFFVPCYSVQNGYYSSDIDVYYSTPVTREDGNIETWVTKHVLNTDGEWIEG